MIRDKILIKINPRKETIEFDLGTFIDGAGGADESWREREYAVTAVYRSLRYSRFGIPTFEEKLEVSYTAPETRKGCSAEGSCIVTPKEHVMYGPIRKRTSSPLGSLDEVVDWEIESTSNPLHPSKWKREVIELAKQLPGYAKALLTEVPLE